MSAAEKRRVAWAYAPNTPMCCNCVGYRKAKFDHNAEGSPTLHAAKCIKGRFEVVANGCCNKWSSRDGERLESS